MLSANLRASGSDLLPSGRVQEIVGNVVVVVAFKEANSPRRWHRGSRMWDVAIEIRFASIARIVSVGWEHVESRRAERGQGMWVLNGLTDHFLFR